MKRSKCASLLGWLAIAGLVGCAGGGVNERSYRRDGLQSLPLKSIDVIVVATRPRVSEDINLDVTPFEPPSRDRSPFVAPDRDPATEKALREALRARLAGLGYDVRFVEAGALPIRPIETATSSVGTSTTIVQTASIALAARPPPPSPLTSRGAPLDVGEHSTLGDILAASDRDVVAVVRVVPIDRFMVDEGEGARIDVTTGTRDFARDQKPVAHHGRLMLGQLFVFDRHTGLRLLTKQAPDFPEHGRITKDHPFLAYGFVAPAPTVPASTRAQAASRAFVDKMLSDFPAAHAGDPAARAALDSVDVDAELGVETFLDEDHVSFDLQLSYGAEPAEAELTFFDAPLAPLGTAAIAGSGLVRVVPSGAYVSTGGMMYSVAVPIGIGPSEFGRTYYRDNPMPTTERPNDHAGRVGLSGVSTFGLELSLGYLIRLSPRSATFFLIPRGGAFGEVWFVDIAPGSIATDDSRLRLGVFGGADVLLMWAEDSPLYLRAGANGRLGVDLDAPFVVGFGVSAGVGILL